MRAWQELEAGVFRRRYAGLDLNIGLVAGDREALLVDTRSTEEQGIELAADARRLAGVPVRHVVNTHAHFDHAFGNAAFADATIYGHRRCIAALRDAGEDVRRSAVRWLPDRAAEIAAVRIAPPAVAVSGHGTVLDLGGRRVEIRFLGRGHTDGDLLVLVPDADVAFAGDLLEEGAPPSFEDSFPLDWPATVRRLLRVAAAAADAGLVVPGHGSLMDRGRIEAQARLLASVAAAARRVLRGECQLEDVAAQLSIGREAGLVALRRALGQVAGIPRERGRAHGDCMGGGTRRRPAG
jgi:glyoxylase-like metal-dependent hydrolase (beta-lactamase superfamily II)